MACVRSLHCDRVWRSLATILVENDHWGSWERTQWNDPGLLDWRRHRPGVQAAVPGPGYRWFRRSSSRFLCLPCSAGSRVLARSCRAGCRAQPQLSCRGVSATLLAVPLAQFPPATAGSAPATFGPAAASVNYAYGRSPNAPYAVLTAAKIFPMLLPNMLRPQRPARGLG